MPLAHTSVTTTAPATEPVSLAVAKAQLRIDHNFEDSLLSGLVAAARKKLEEDTERCITTSTYPETCVMRMDEFPAWEILLRRCPVLAVSSIVYLDSLGVSQTLSASKYIVDAASEPGRITPAYGQAWPSTYPVSNAVTITFTGGYTALNPVALQAMLLLIDHWYEHRGLVGSNTALKPIPMAYSALKDTLLWGGYR